MMDVKRPLKQVIGLCRDMRVDFRVQKSNDYLVIESLDLPAQMFLQVYQSVDNVFPVKSAIGI